MTAISLDLFLFQIASASYRIKNDEIDYRYIDVRR